MSQILVRKKNLMTMTSDQIKDHQSLFAKASPQILVNRKELKF